MDTESKVSFRFYLTRFAWIVIAVIVVALLAVGSVYTYRSLVGQSPRTETTESPAGLVDVLVSWGLDLRIASVLAIGFESASGLTSVVLGVLLFLRLLSPKRAHDRMAMFTSLMLITYGLLITNVTDVIAEGMEPWNMLYTLVGFLASVLFFLFLLIFPDGRYRPRWTVWIPWSTLGWLISWFFIPQLNPANWPPVFLSLSVVSLIVLAGSVQVYRYLKIYSPVQRQQTKWVALVLVMMIGFGAAQLLLESDASFVPRAGGVWSLLFVLEQIIFNLLEVVFPVTLFLVIVRYRLWEVDRLINKVLVYSMVTLLLVGVYFTVVVALQGLFGGLAGQDSPLAVVASTLTIAAIFNPARAQVQSFVDRRFYRKQYDAGQALSEFSALVWQETELETLTDRLRDVVQNTLQPDGLGLWLAPVQSGITQLDANSGD
jgi:hypothetical protein